MEREIMIGDLVRIASRHILYTAQMGLVGLVVGVTNTQSVGILEPGLAAHVAWMNKTTTKTSFLRLERVRR